MSEPAAITPEPSRSDRYEAVLAELVEIGMISARDLQVRLVASGEAADAAQLAHALDRMARSVRLTVALAAKIERQKDLDARAAAQDVTKAREKKRALIRGALERRILDEVEVEAESDLMLDELEERVALATSGADFDDADLGPLIAALAVEIGLDPPPPSEAPARPAAEVLPFGEGSNVAPAQGWPVKAFPSDSS